MKSIRQFVIEALENTKVFEMAFKRKDFMRTVDSLKFQILENWILIRYCTLADSNLDIRNHWCSELFGHLHNLYMTKIDSDKKRALEQQLIEYSEFDDPDIVESAFFRKLEKEKSIIKSDTVLNICYEDFVANGIEEMIDLVSRKISTSNTKLLQDYVYNRI